MPRDAASLRAAPRLHGDLALVELDGPGADTLSQHGAVVVTATARKILVDGVPVLTLDEQGKVRDADRPAPSDREVMPLRRHLESRTRPREHDGVREHSTTVGAPVLFLLDHRLSVDLLIDLLFTANLAGHRRFLLGARRDSELVAIPLTLPAPAPIESRTVEDPPDESVQLCVAATRRELLLFSFSELEGTIAEPAMRVPGHGPDAREQLRRTLVEITDRRPAEHRIVAMLDPSLPMQSALPVLAAVRARADGSALLPEVVLATGYR